MHIKQCLAYALQCAIENYRDDSNVSDFDFRIAAQENFLKVADTYYEDGLLECTCEPSWNPATDYARECEQFRQLDAEYQTDPLSPLHHDNRCRAHD